VSDLEQQLTLPLLIFIRGLLKYTAVIMLLGWAVWLVAWQSYEISDSYETMASLGDEWVLGVLFGSMGLLCGIALRVERSVVCVRRVALVLGAAYAAICGFFAFGATASTGTWIYGCIAVGHLLVWNYLRYLDGGHRG
tara:strand:+ start:149 stop:562 length:414 start_codon:yes stop_codon:yes gene_type:complete